MDNRLELMSDTYHFETSLRCNSYLLIHQHDSEGLNLAALLYKQVYMEYKNCESITTFSPKTNDHGTFRSCK